MKYMIGVDIGTTSTKAVIYNNEGKFLKKHSIEYPMTTDEIGVAEESLKKYLMQCFSQSKKL